MKTLYESAIADMAELLEDTIENFSKGYEAYPMKPLFCVSNKQFPLMKTVSECSNGQVLRVCQKLCTELCEASGFKIDVLSQENDIDLVVEMQGRKIGILVSFMTNYMPKTDALLIDILDQLIVVVLQEATEKMPVFYPPNSFKYRSYEYGHKIKNITIKQFLEMLGRDDYEDFRECVGRYNYDAEQMLGITVSAIPTAKAVVKHKEKIRERLLGCFYESEIRTIFDEKEIVDMKAWFEKNYEVLTSDADFAKSFISSEWYYDLQVMTNGGIDQTAIVAGYLKSLEQILISILLVLSEDENNEFLFWAKPEVKEQTGKQKLPLTKENQKLVFTMANNILKTIRPNKKDVLRKTKMTNRVLEYLEEYVDKMRNGYMHKDNLYEWSDIQNIRTKTYAAYFMVLGTFFIDVEKLSHIND